MYHFRERYGSNSKKGGMLQNNIEADVLLEEFIGREHPELANECNSFMLYEYVTAIQNALAHGDADKSEIKIYKDKVRALSKVNNPLVAKSLKIKVMMALFAPFLLKAYTKKMQKSVATQLERFP